MAIVLSEGRLTFHFPDDALVSQYDTWSFYRNQFNGCFGGTKAVDFVCVDASRLWLIEVKDYRTNARTKIEDLGDEVAAKVRDTMAGLLAAQVNANDPQEKQLAREAVSRSRIHVVLHLEQPAKQSRLFPRVVDPVNLQIKLKQRLGAVDAHPKVLNQGNIPVAMGWTVTG